MLACSNKFPDLSTEFVYLDIDVPHRSASPKPGASPNKASLANANSNDGSEAALKLHDDALTEVMLKISDPVSRLNFLQAINTQGTSAALHNCTRQVTMFGFALEKGSAADAGFYLPTFSSGATEARVDDYNKDFFAKHVNIDGKCRNVRMDSTTLIYALIDLRRICEGRESLIFVAISYGMPIGLAIACSTRISSANDLHPDHISLV